MIISAFEILGPIMVGPSSSHTAGAVRIGLVARELGPAHLARVRFTLYNSFAHTYTGHGTDRALVAGVLGLLPQDARVKDALDLAAKRGLKVELVPAADDKGAGKHPNTVEAELVGADGTSVTVCAESLGGGKVRVSSLDGVACDIRGDVPTLFVAHRDTPGVLAALTARISQEDINIATMRTFRRDAGGAAYTIFEVDDFVPSAVVDDLMNLDFVTRVKMVDIPGTLQVDPNLTLEREFSSGRELLELCQAYGVGIGELMHAREREICQDKKACEKAMAEVLEVMRTETTANLAHPERSLGGFLHGEAKALWQTAAPNSTSDTTPRSSLPALASLLMGEVLTRACAYAMAVLERSAAMGKIVAAPTAGSAGVLPGVILSLAEALDAQNNLSKDQLQARVTRALWNASALGMIVSKNATVAGAEGGCQAEVGTAAAMAASAAVELLRGTPDMCLTAASLALGNLLGLVCDPVRGLVEYPCQDRNVIGVCAAISSAQLALAGIKNPVPFDEVVDAMARVGAALPASLRETALGGLASAPSVATQNSQHDLQNITFSSRCAGCATGGCLFS